MAATAIRAARMFDGTNLHGPSTVVIDDGRIIGVDTSPAPVVAVVDLGDACLLPGLVDAHQHLAFDATADAVRIAAEATDAKLLSVMRSAAQRALHAGVTTVRDLGDRGFLTLTLRELLAKTPGRGPEILAAGPPITTPGGHCHFLGGAATGREELRAAVQERHRRGCDVVKVMSSGGHVTPDSVPPYRTQFSRADLRVVVDEAHRLGLPVAVHAHAVDSIRDALAVGADSIEHATFMTATGIGADPTLLDALAAAPPAISVTVGAPATGGEIPPAALERMHAIAAALTGLRNRGATMILSSDAGIENTPHDLLPRAVELAVAAGWTPLQALTAVTSGPAAVCRVGDRKGRIAAGADADLLAIAGDPTHDPAALQSVVAVYRAGIRVR
ncbi:amidohydrolase family protein [Kribbella sandramycini]|uniref:Amidohydrolase family protein n=1 Tax=Kribbella sandramycini TaxID=60450 RepID=A0A7Y4KXH5_9ACTN|nr:amidohydrolase family protein [Kribbella sandramycini]MBB6569699.1 imidazolonepropionase-like amidohydrolase [Kribbella sandramycini]NOL40470.1 amidohydrolase family protein [Kribbella sandramycini]